MTAIRDDDDRERPSWREIDQRRDRSRHRTPAAPKVPKKQAEWVKKLALRQAEALFKGKKGRPEYQQALKGLEQAHGTKKFPAVAKKFVEEFGLPEEWGSLNLLLDYPEAAVRLEVLKALAALAGSRTRVEQQGFAGKLKILALTSSAEEERHLAEEILEGLP